jgi:plasmid stabilization system protein ParE
MAVETKRIVLSKLAHTQITDLFDELSGDDPRAAESLMDDFLDVVFDEIKHFPDQFPTCRGMRSYAGDYRLAALYEEYRIIFQILKTKVLILLILHESELPF